jgi:hypothetical protein
VFTGGRVVLPYRTLAEYRLPTPDSPEPSPPETEP